MPISISRSTATSYAMGLKMCIRDRLTPVNTLGFMLPTDDADYVRVMDFVWGLVDSRGAVKQAADKWLK